MFKIYSIRMRKLSSN